MTFEVARWASLTLPPSLDVIEAELSCHVNYHAFAAYLGQYKLIYPTYVAISQMRECFEEDWNKPQVPHAYGYIRGGLDLISGLDIAADQAHSKLQSAMISAATMWVLINGSSLFTEMVQCTKDIFPDREGVAFQTGVLFKGPIFGIKRWVFWREGFEAAARGEHVDEKCAELAGKAADLMQSLEQSMWY